MSDSLHQELSIGATPERIFELLTDGAQFSRMTGGAPAEIDASPGGAFSCFGGMIEGRMIEVEAPTRVVQAWRAKNWDPGVYSTVHFEITLQDGQTHLSLDHRGFPEGQEEHLAKGWHANYWEPMKKLLAS